MARWINVTEPFEYSFKDRRATVAFAQKDLGDHLVVDEIADFAVERGKASEGKFNPASRSKKGGKKAARSRAARTSTRAKASTTKSAGQPSRSQTGATKGAEDGKTTVDDATANLRRADRLAGEDTNSDGRADIQPAVGSSAS